MARAVRQLATEALQLPEEERLALATELIDSVEGLPDPEWETAWLRELSARDQAKASDYKTWSLVRSRILKRLTKP